MDRSCGRVVVLSRNYSTGLGVIRALGEAGFEVELVASTKKRGSSGIAASSKYVRSCTEVLSSDITRDDGKALAELLLKRAENTGHKAVLFPTDDFTASVTALYRDGLEKYYYLPHTDGLSMAEAMDKSVQSKLARAAGLKTPHEFTVRLSDISVPDDARFPCFVKPLAGTKGLKSEMAACRNREELITKLEEMKKKDADRSVLVQEYLDIQKEYDLSGVCTGEAVVIPGVIEKTRIAQHERGVTLAGRLLPLDTLGDAAQKVVTLMKSLHYVGMFDMELNLCGDELWFGEINLRSGGPNYAYTLAGVNLPEIFVKAVTGQKLEDPAKLPLKFGRSFVYEKVAWEDHIYGYMSRRKLRECLSSADDMLLCRDSDPKPGRIFRRRIRLSAVKHRIKILLGLEKAGAPEKKPPDVIVTGRNWANILSLLRALGRAGVSVGVLRLYKTKPPFINLLRRMKPESKSRYISFYRELVTGDDAASYAFALKALAPTGRKPVLIPSDDYSAYITDELFDELREYYELPSVGGKAGGICRLMDKSEQKKLAKKAGVPCLDTVVLSRDKLPDDVSFPCFVKPSVSMLGTKAELRRCDTYAELRAAVNKAACDLICEPFADIVSEYSLLGVSRNNEVTAPCVFELSCGGHRERKGVAVSGRVISAKEIGDIADKCAEFVKSLDYTGLFDIDLIKTADGKVYFAEINFRCGASVHAFTESGVNLPALYCGVPGKTVPEPGKSFVSEKLLIEELARGDMSLKQVRSLIKDSDIHFTDDSLDKRPYRYFALYYGIALLLRLPYRIKNREERK